MKKMTGMRSEDGKDMNAKGKDRKVMLKSKMTKGKTMSGGMKSQDGKDKDKNAGMKAEKMLEQKGKPHRAGMTKALGDVKRAKPLSGGKMDKTRKELEKKSPLTAVDKMKPKRTAMR